MRTLEFIQSPSSEDGYTLAGVVDDAPGDDEGRGGED